MCRSRRPALPGPSLLALALALGACTGTIRERGSTEGASGDPASPGSELQPEFGTESGNDPGRVTLHRLNRAEYNNTVRDLFGTALTPADDFPVDDHGYGFDNIADVLSVSPSQVELYERAAQALVDEALAAPAADPIFELIEAETLSGSVGAAGQDSYNLWSAGDLEATFALPSDGTYRVSARVWGDQAGPEPVQVQLRAGATDLGIFDVTVDESSPMVIERETELVAGSNVVTVSFLNDFYDEAAGLDRNLRIDWIQVEGPLDAAAPSSAQRDAIMICDPVSGGTSCVRDILSAFAKRAWRRPPTDAEIDRLVGFVGVAEGQGDGVEQGIRLAVRAIVMSPHFVFRVELDPDPTSAVAHPLTDYELASRLSYFLWSSMPDDALFARADAGELADPATVESEARRMLADPKAAELIDNFAGQWLFTRALDEHEPDYNFFPDYDEGLRDAFKAETKLFFEEFLDQNVPIEQLLTADYSFLNDRLAAHYGLPDPGGPDFQKVALGTDQRGGLLRQGVILTVTSYPTRTSPVKRGKWVLAQLLCSEPPPPPPGVEADLAKEELEAASLREVLAQHRANPECAACHDQMDPVGLALENFDGIGAWRGTDDSGTVIDPTGTLPDGTPLDGPASLANTIAADPRFGACIAEKMFTYALGRGPEPHDEPYLESIVENLGTVGFTFEELVAEIVTSEPFRMRRGEFE